MRTGIALGSNLGDRRTRLAAARALVFSLHEGAEPALCSGLYETEPVDCTPGTNPFLNAVVEVRTRLEPENLLRRLQEFERRSGRAAQRGKNSPREIDLDLLYMDQLLNNSPAVTLPHPRMTERRFVLQPLADICPDYVVPGQKSTVTDLLSQLSPDQCVRLLSREW